MDKNTIFTFLSESNVEVIAVVVAVLTSDKYQSVYLCYAQNRLFTYCKHIQEDPETGESDEFYFYGERLVDYAILPDYDELLKKYSELQNEILD